MRNAGKYNRRISIYKINKDKDSDGFPSETEPLVLNVYAEVKTTKGFTLIANNADFEKALTRFVFRFPETVITYDMVDSSKEHYIYEEQILIQTIDEELQVTDCDVTISNLTSEQYWQAVNIAADLQNGHETWRLDTEQVANIFMTDYLNLSWDEVVEQRRSYEFNT